MAKETAPALLTSKYQVDTVLIETSVGEIFRSFPCLDSGRNKIEYDGPLTGSFQTSDIGGEIRFERLSGSLAWRTGKLACDLRCFGKKDVFEDQEGRLLLSVADAYFNVLQSVRVLESAQAELEGLDERLKEAEALRSRSLLAITELYEVQARRDMVAADVIGAEGDKLVAEEGLTQLIGVRDFTLFSASSTNLLLPSAST